VILYSRLGLRGRGWELGSTEDIDLNAQTEVSASAVKVTLSQALMNKKNQAT